MNTASGVPGRPQGGDTPGEATIGEIAREFGLSLRTLRFYEDRGLLHPRRRGPHRLYEAADRRRLQTILKGKQFGFTLAEIAELIGAQRPDVGEADLEESLGPERIADQIIHLERQRDEIEAAIVQLRATRQRQREACADL